MTEAERTILNSLQHRGYNLKMIEELRNKIKSKTYRITPSYSGVGGRSGNSPASKVENFVENVDNLLRKMEACKRELQIANKALSCPGLTERERSILEWIATGGKPAEYAEMQNIYISRVYKIRDKALEKVSYHIMR